MGRATRFLLIAVPVLLSSATVAFADTYRITADAGDPGAISGSISGTGTTVSSYDITAVNGFGPFTFDSAVAGNSGGLQSQDAFTASGRPVNFFEFVNPQGENLSFDVTGDFTSGLIALLPQNLYSATDVILGSGGGINMSDFFGDGTPIGTLTLTAVVTPEPSSWILLLSGVIGLGILGMERRWLHRLPDGQAPDLLAAWPDLLLAAIHTGAAQKFCGLA